MSDYHDQRAKAIVSTVKYATIATANESGNPWNTPVAHVIDESRDIYWIPDKNNQHSRNIRSNSNVAIVIYDSTVPIGDGEGVYIKATATELNTFEEVSKACNQVLGIDCQSGPGEFLGDELQRIYKATPEKFWINDAEMKDGQIIRDFRIEVSL